MEQRTETSKLSDLLLANKRQIDKIILDFLPQRHDSPEIMKLYEMMRDYPSRGGKGLRATMCLVWCNLFGGSREDAMITAAALELFQNWILIHDDIEDKSDLRRGLPALHRKVGIELAINTGDALHGKMWELLLLNQIKLGSDLTLRILSEFSTMLNDTTEGQQMELSWTTGNRWNMSVDDYFLMVTKKSAWYTCITPTRLGILLAKKERDIQEIKTHQIALKEAIEFGTHLGISFQIIDDVLNLKGDQSKYGKEILGDLFEGKRTLMVIHLLSKCGTDQKRRIIETLSKPREEKTLEEVKYIFEQMNVFGSIDYAKQIANQLSERALSEFESIISKQGINREDPYEITKSLIEYISSREY